MIGIDAGGSPAQSEAKIAVRVKSGRGEERVIELDSGTNVTAILEIVATERGCPVAELVLLREGHSELLTSDVVLDGTYPCNCRHHVLYAGEVTVTVCYQDGQKERAFKPFEAIKDVLEWAIEAFAVDAAMATEFELARRGEKEELPGSEQVGHLAGKNCALALDLVRGNIANGGCR